MKKRTRRSLVLFRTVLMVLPLFGLAQTTIVVGAFNNKSNRMFLDGWQRSIPDIIRSNLSMEEDIQVLQRDKLNKVLEEKALGQTGLIDSARSSVLSPLSAADFILTGTIDSQDGNIVITADMVRVKTGQVVTERVLAADRSFKEPMTAMLVNNLLFRLNKQGVYINEKIVPSHVFWYWSVSTLVFGAGAFVSRSVYLDNYKKYHAAERLQDFDGYYTKANNANKLSSTLFILAAGAATGALTAWFRQKKSQTISSGFKSEITVLPKIKWDYEKNLTLGFNIHF